MRQGSSTTEVLAAHDDCLIVVRSWKRTADVWVSGADRNHVDRLAQRLRGSVPAAPKQRAVRVTFWQIGRHRWQRSRDITVPTWGEVEQLYPRVVRETMARLLTYRPRDDSVGGRLLLWHGAPGTGKTTAVRALFDAWRDWASAHVVSDAEQLLNNGDHMAQVLLDLDDGLLGQGSRALVLLTTNESIEDAPGAAAAWSLPCPHGVPSVRHHRSG